MIGDDKRGKFLQFLRNKKGLTQQELAKMIHYTDKNISKWENGKSFPTNPNTIEKLAQIFNVSFEEIMYGELKNKDNEENIVNNVKEEYLSSYNKFNKIIKYIVITVLTMIIVFLVLIYYFYIKNSIYYYSAIVNYNNNEKNKITLLLTNKVNVFNFPKIDDPENKIKTVSLYYTGLEKEELIFEGENDNYYIFEKYGYNSHNFKALINSESYLIIKYKDNTEEKISLNFNVDYNNDNIFPKNVSSLTDTEQITSEKLIENLKKSGFKDEEFYYLKKFNDNVICRYYVDMNQLEIVIEKDNIIETLSTYIDTQQIFYEKLDDGALVISKEIGEDGKTNCDMVNCKTIEDFTKYINYLKYD